VSELRYYVRQNETKLRPRLFLGPLTRFGFVWSREASDIHYFRTRAAAETEARAWGMTGLRICCRCVEDIEVTA
jgi:hypothetical protein